MIVTHALTKRFGRTVAVDAVDLQVREGDRYGFLGPNGSGKTTLVRMLLGLVYATSGEIEVLAVRCRSGSPRYFRTSARWWRGRRPIRTCPGGATSRCSTRPALVVPGGRDAVASRKPLSGSGWRGSTGVR